MKTGYLVKAPGNEILNRCRRARKNLQKRFKNREEFWAYVDQFEKRIPLRKKKKRGLPQAGFLVKAPGNEILDRCRAARHELQRRYKTIEGYSAYLDEFEKMLNAEKRKKRKRAGKI